jgi:hypothetical protein
MFLDLKILFRKNPRKDVRPKKGLISINIETRPLISLAT